MIPRKAGRALAASAAFALAAAGCQNADAPIHIGIAGPLEAANGISMRHAAELAVDQINAAGGVRGRPLALVMMNDSASPATALRVARALRENPEVVAVVGHVNSAASLAAAQVYNAPRGHAEYGGNPVAQISPASSSPALTHAGEWTFRITPTDLEFSPALAGWAADQLGSRRAAVLYANDQYGQGVRSTFEEAFVARGGVVISGDPYLPAMFDDEAALDPYLVRALRRNADALVIGGQADAGVKIIRAARRLGYGGPILGADGLTNVKDAGEVAEGVFVSSAFLPDRPTEVAQRFVQAYVARFGTLPDHRGAMTYDIVHMLRDAIGEAGTDRRSIRDYVARIGRGGRGDPRAYEGVSGTVAFDENGDVVGKEVAVGVVRDGDLVTAAR